MVIWQKTWDDAMATILIRWVTPVGYVECPSLASAVTRSVHWVRPGVAQDVAVSVHRVLSSSTADYHRKADMCVQRT